jgi:hypothetical protein
VFARARALLKRKMNAFYAIRTGALKKYPKCLPHVLVKKTLNDG